MERADRARGPAALGPATTSIAGLPLRPPVVQPGPFPTALLEEFGFRSDWAASSAPGPHSVCSLHPVNQPTPVSCRIYRILTRAFEIFFRFVRRKSKTLTRSHSWRTSFCGLSRRVPRERTANSGGNSSMKTGTSEPAYVFSIENLCPRCDGKLIIRRRRADGGKFIGCARFPECNFTDAFLEEEHGLLKRVYDLELQLQQARTATGSKRGLDGLLRELITWAHPDKHPSGTVCATELTARLNVFRSKAK